METEDFCKLQSIQTRLDKFRMLIVATNVITKMVILKYTENENGAQTKTKHKRRQC